MRLRIALFISLILLVTVATGLSLARQSAGFDLSWWTVDGGGGVASGSNYTLSGTAGQADVAQIRGPSYTLTSGFWAAATTGGGTGGTIYIPMLLK